jgi:hypothetical protein
VEVNAPPVTLLPHAPLDVVTLMGRPLPDTPELPAVPETAPSFLALQSFSRQISEAKLFAPVKFREDAEDRQDWKNG